MIHITEPTEEMNKHIVKQRNEKSYMDCSINRINRLLILST